jgi:hypothetical protein
MCSYCGCRNIPLIGPLSQQHQDITNCTYPLRTAMLAGAEHETIDSAVDAIVAGDLTRIQPLLTLLYNHIDREENGLFPAALAFLDNEQWDRLRAPEMLGGA